MVDGHSRRAVTPWLLALLWLWLGPLAAAEPAAVEIEITTHLGDQQEFAEGDVISFFLSLDQEAWVYLFYRDAGNNLIQLLPNSGMPEHRYPAGAFMPIPSREQAFRFTVAPPFGDELILAFASDRADIELPGQRLPTGLRLLGVDAATVEQSIREASGERYGRAQLALSTRPGDD